MAHPVRTEAPAMQALPAMAPDDTALLVGSMRELDAPQHNDQLSLITAQASLANLERKYPDHASEIEPYLAKGRRLIATMMPPPDPTKPAAGAQWYAANANFSACNRSRSPADRIEEIRDAGGQPDTKDETDADGNLSAVEVSVTEGLQERLWTYYRTKADCDASVVARHAIPDQYR